MLGAIVRTIARLLLQREWIFVRSYIEEIITSGRTHPDLDPPLLAQRLLVSAEDHRHGRHAGFDLHAICRAVFRRIISGRREGASTIEQQIVRVVTKRFELTLCRKLHEILLASLVASHFPKSVSPLVYLKIGYYGWQMNNYSQACRRLKLQPNKLSLDDAATLVARLKYPEPRISPPKRVAQIAQRTEYLKRLYRTHIIGGTYNHLGIEKYGSIIRDTRKFTEALSSAPVA